MLVNDKRSVTPEMAVLLSVALGPPPERWLELESARQLRIVDRDATDVARRARVYDLAPIQDMVRRGWLPSTSEPEELEDAVLAFFDVPNLDAQPTLSVAARKRNDEAPMTSEQRAWVFRARQMARTVAAGDYDGRRNPKLTRKLRALAAYPDDVRLLSKTLAEFGIRLVVVEPLPGGSIDGAAFWLDDHSPVIALSARFDRVDWLWHTVLHEYVHVRHRDGTAIDVSLVGRGAVPAGLKSEIERRADNEAADMLVPTAELESFIRRVGPLYSKARIIRFAHRLKVHPGIVVGQLQYREEIGYQANREMLAKVRERLTSSTLTDGWGHEVGVL